MIAVAVLISMQSSDLVPAAAASIFVQFYIGFLYTDFCLRPTLCNDVYNFCLDRNFVHILDGIRFLHMSWFV